MPNVNEINAVTAEIQSILVGDAQIMSIVGFHPGQPNIPQVYEEEALQGASVPFIVHKIYSSGRVRRNQGGGNKVLVKFFWDILAVDSGEDFSTVGTLSDHIERLFERNQVLDAPVILGMGAVALLKFGHVDDGVRYLHMGSRVEVFAYGQGS